MNPLSLRPEFLVKGALNVHQLRTAIQTVSLRSL